MTSEAARIKLVWNTAKDLISDIGELAARLDILLGEQLAHAYAQEQKAADRTKPAFITYSLVTGDELFRGSDASEVTRQTTESAEVGGRCSVHRAGSTSGLYYELIQFNGDLPDPGALLYQTIGIGTPLHRDFLPYPKPKRAG